MRKFLVLTLVLSALVSIAAFAGDTTFYLGPTYTVTSKTPAAFNIPDRAGLAIGANFQQWKHFSINPYLYTNYNQLRSYKTGAKAGYSIFGADLDLRFTVNPQDAVHFWVLGGLSYTRTQLESISGVTNSIAPNIGLGFNYPFSKVFGFTLEAKYRYLPKSASPYNTLIQLDNYSAFAGLSLTF